VEVDKFAGKSDMVIKVLRWRVGAEVVILGKVVEIRRGNFGGDTVHHFGGWSRYPGR